MKHIFIINPVAGIGESQSKVLPEVIEHIKNHGEDFEIHRSLNKQEIVSYVSSRASIGDPVRFYAVGGDGTICDVLNGLMGNDNAQLAVIPCGSGNDFVKNFSNRNNFMNLNRQLTGSIEKLDVIKYNDSYCINMVNIGIDCDIAARSVELRAQKRFEGAMSYAVAALQLMPEGTVYDLEYTDPEGFCHRSELMLAAIGNGKFCGGGFKGCPRASLKDGLMDIGLVKLCQGIKLPKMLVKYRRGTHLEDRDADRYCIYRQVKECTLIPHQRVNVCVDGEISPFTETHFEVIPAAVSFVVPSGSKLIE